MAGRRQVPGVRVVRVRRRAGRRGVRAAAEVAGAAVWISFILAGIAVIPAIYAVVKGLGLRSEAETPSTSKAKAPRGRAARAERPLQG